MELKYDFQFNHNLYALSSNRTFMELKFVPGALARSGALVLIAPLWN